jgi:hypothetical protein
LTWLATALGSGVLDSKVLRTSLRSSSTGPKKEPLKTDDNPPPVSATTPGQPSGSPGKIMGKPWEIHGKIYYNLVLMGTHHLQWGFSIVMFD